MIYEAITHHSHKTRSTLCPRFIPFETEGCHVKIGFYSCMSGMPWGGSEMLWYKVAKRLQSQGHQLAINYKYWPHTAKELLELENDGATLTLRDRPKSSAEKRKALLGRLIGHKPVDPQWIAEQRPDAVLVTLGYHPDPIPVADQCIEMGIPYGINLQCASDFFFIHSNNLENFRRWYKNAKRVYFVSDENANKIKNNIALNLDNSEVIANPFNVSVDAAPQYPDASKELRVAVVGRVHFQSKGQDLIVDVLRRSKWKDRDIKVVFYGHDQGNMAQLKGLVEMHGLEGKVEFGGYVSEVEDIWKQNHGLLLPSRYEGAPLVVIEAMLCNRVCITTNIGRNTELMDDNVSGFIAEGATINLVDEALERAWQKRDQWEAMGKVAGQHIRARYPKDPVQEFADRIKSLVE